MSISYNNTTQEFNNHDHDDGDRVLTVVLESTTLIVIMVAAFCLNSATIFVILRTASLLRTFHTLLILNLCLVDLLLVFSSMSFSLHAVFDGGRFLMSHHFICKYLNGIPTMTFCITGLASIFNIAVDRLLLVVFAQRFPPKRRRIYAMIAVSWLAGLLVSCMRASGILSGYQFANSTRDCAAPIEDSLARTIMIIRGGVFAPALLLIYAIMTFYIWREGRRLLRHTLAKSKPAAKPMSTGNEDEPTEIQLDPQDSSFISGEPSGKNLKTPSAASEETPSLDPVERSVGHEDTATNVARRNPKYAAKRRRQIHQAHRRVAIMGAMLIAATILCWTPFYLYHASYLTFIKSPWLGVSVMWLAYCNAILDPLIYAFMNRRVRAEMCRMSRKAKGKLLALCRG